ncbi:MAG: EamA family transporter [Planctomycetales bacterium]|nr:EamA family transporter [Planctomycetales bacterium]
MQQAENIRRARALIVVAAVMWSTSGFFAKAPLFAAWPVESRGLILAFWRAVFAGIFLLPFVRRPRFHWGLVPATLIFAAMNVTYLNAMARTTAANAIWLQYISPAWVFILGVIFLKETATRRDVSMLLMATLGVGFILAMELAHTDSTGSSLIGVYWGLSSGVLLALVILSLRMLREFDAVWLIALNHLVTAALVAFYVVPRYDAPTPKQLGWLFCFGVFQMGTPYVLFAKGVRTLPGHQASFLLLLEPLLVPVWVWLAWRDHPEYVSPSWWTFVGGALILTGLIVCYARLPDSGRRRMTD